MNTNTVPRAAPPHIQDKASSRLALGSLALSMLLSSMGVSIPNVALPTLVRAFDSSFQAVQWVVLAYLLTMTVLIVGVGRIADVVGRRRVLLAGIALFTAAAFLAGLASELWLLITARAVQGLGAAILMALTVANVREVVPKARTGAAMGLLGTMSAIGTAAGPSLGGLLLAGLGWRAIFLVMVPLGLLNFVLGGRYLPAQQNDPQAERPRFDFLGMVILALTLAAYCFSVTIGGSEFGFLNAGLLVVSLLGLVFFAIAQRHAAAPTVRPGLLEDPALVAALVNNALVATVLMATLVVGPFFLTGALGLNDAIVGIVISVGPLASALAGVPAGRSVDRWGHQRAMAYGLALVTGGSFALSVLPNVFGVWGYVAALLVLTPGYQLFLAANNTAVMLSANPDERAVISGVLQLSRNLGLITGASVMGAVFALAAGPDGVAAAGKEFLGRALWVTFSVGGVLGAVSLGIAIGTRALAPRPATSHDLP